MALSFREPHELTNHRNRNGETHLKQGSSSLLGIAEFIVPTGSFFHAQTHVLIPYYRRAFPKCEDEPEKCTTFAIGNIRASPRFARRYWVSSDARHVDGQVVSITVYLGYKFVDKT